MSTCDEEHCPAVLDNIEKEFIDGVMYQRFALPFSVREMLNRAEAMEVLEDDVITIGYPRSGNHWAFEVVHMILNQTTEFSPTNFAFNVIERRVSTPGALDKDVLPAPRHLTTHLRPALIGPQTIKKGAKIIYLLRNPKDVTYSTFLLWGRLKEHKDKYLGTWDELVDLMLTGYALLGSWFDHVLAAEKFMEENPEVPVYVHVYEEMKQNPTESIKKLCQFLEVPDTRAEEFAKASEFLNMKTKAKKLDEAEYSLFVGKENPSLLRKGVVGDWKNHFTVAQNERFNKFFKEKMAGSKLARRIEKYIDL